MKAKHVVGGLVIVLCVVVAGISLKGTFTPYVSIKEAKDSGREVQVAGSLVKDTTFFDKNTGEYTFSIKDESGEKILIRTAETLPSNFEQSTNVVAKGKFDGKEFYAGTVLVKCPSKYEKEIETNPNAKHPEEIQK